jgi:hypothetical protein
MLRSIVIGVVCFASGIHTLHGQQEIVVIEPLVDAPKDQEALFEALLGSQKSKKAGSESRFRDSLGTLLRKSLVQCVTTNQRGTAANAEKADSAALNRPDHGFLVHLAEWNGEAIRTEKWYVYDLGVGWASVRPTDLRIFGRHGITLIYFHRAAPSAPTYKLTIASKRQAPVQALRDLGELALTVLDARAAAMATAAAPLKCAGREFAVRSPSDLSVELRIAPAQARPVAGDSKAESKNLQALSTQQLDNEGLYWWDISVGLPLMKVNQLQYNVDDGTVRTAKIDKQNLFALFNLFPLRTDLKRTRLQFPHFVGGVAISSKPLDRFFGGIAVGLNVGQIMFGYDFTKRERPRTLQPGNAATPAQLKENLRTFYKGVVILGLNVPVRQVLQSVQGK